MLNSPVPEIVPEAPMDKVELARVPVMVLRVIEDVPVPVTGEKDERLVKVLCRLMFENTLLVEMSVALALDSDEEFVIIKLIDVVVLRLVSVLTDTEVVTERLLRELLGEDVVDSSVVVSLRLLVVVDSSDDEVVSKLPDDVLVEP